MAAQAARLAPGLALGVTVFAYHDNFVTKRIIQNIITMAKTRATAMLRQQHLPPNVMANLKTKMKPLCFIVLVTTILNSCISKSGNQASCKLDSIDYQIYSKLIDKYVLPAIDSCLVADDSIEQITYIKNPRRNLLLIDSTRSYTAITSFQYLKSDTVLFESFIEKSKLKCSLDSSINKSLILYKISQSDFLGYFKTDVYNGYKELYKKYRDVTGILEFSSIGYNHDRTCALVEICFYEAPLNSFGLFVWLRYENGKWTVEAEYLDWVS